MNTPLTAIIWGSTGLIGSELISLLANDPRYSKVICPVRNLTKIEKSQSVESPTGSSKISEIQINFEDLEKNLLNQDSKFLNQFQADHVFVTLGTTIKKAGSQEAFHRVDYDYCLIAGRIAEATEAKVFSLVTAIGSSAKSPIFYNRVKGELEEAVSRLNIPKIRVFQPSLLLGNRKEFRLGEKVGEVVSAPLSFLLMGGLKKYRPIQGREVAEKMVGVANEVDRDFPKDPQSNRGNDSRFLRMDFS